MTRRNADFYPTPWCLIDALLNSCPPPVGPTVVEPSAGDGAIVRALVGRGYRVMAIEQREEESGNLIRSGASEVVISDWLSAPPMPTGRFSIVGNPPFRGMLEHVCACINAGAEYVALLLPTAFRHSASRAAFVADHPWTAERPIINRVSFTGEGSPPRDVCWYIWDRMYAAMNIVPLWATP